MDVKEVFLANADALIIWSDVGRLSDVRPQPLNAEEPMDVSVDRGSIMSVVSDETSLSKLLGTLVMSGPISTEVGAYPVNILLDKNEV